jgi:hypothetical protein
MRNEERLDSNLHGVVRFDCDVLLHRYCIHADQKSSREIQCVMFVEVKIGNEALKDAQQDTLSMWSQVLRNRVRNMHRDKRGKHADDHIPLASTYSHVLKRRVRLKLFGGHLLRLSGLDPSESAVILWDDKSITVDQLLALLKFELDPDSLQPIDWRRRYKAFKDQNLFVPAEREAV